MNQKTAIVTGGAAGIGKATCELLIKNSYNVVVSDINATVGEETIQALKAAGGEAIFHQADVSKYEEVQALVDKAIEQYGRLDLMVNNAGIGSKDFQKAAEHSLEDWNRVIAVNQSGVFYGMQLALRQMQKQGSGNIVNVASLAGVRGSGTGMAYSASKFAVVGMTKSAAWEYGGKNIRINCVCPSFTETQLVNESPLGIPEVRAKLIKSNSMRRFADPEEIAQAIIWLASNESSFVTGHALVLDGGIL